MVNIIRTNTQEESPSSKGNNKGFTLIEIAIVIAILALLLGLLAPSLLKYVESSRMQKDESVLIWMEENSPAVKVFTA